MHRAHTVTAYPASGVPSMLSSGDGRSGRPWKYPASPHSTTVSPCSRQSGGSSSSSCGVPQRKSFWRTTLQSSMLSIPAHASPSVIGRSQFRPVKNGWQRHVPFWS